MMNHEMRIFGILEIESIYLFKVKIIITIYLFYEKTIMHFISVYIEI